MVVLGRLDYEDLLCWRTIACDTDAAQMHVNDLTLDMARAINDAETRFLEYVYNQFDIDPETLIIISPVTGVIYRDE